MHTLPARRPLRAVGLVLAWVVAVATLPAAPAAPEVKPKAPTPAEKIRAALDKTVNLTIDGQPFHLALNQIRDEFGVPFVLDRFTLQQLGIDPEQLRVDFKARDVKLRTAVRSILAQHNLSFAVIGDSVVVTTDEMAMYRQMRQRVNVDFDNVEFAKALKQLARETGTNLILDTRVAKEAKGAVTLQLEDVPLETAVRLTAEMVGLKPVRVGNVMFICGKEAAAEMRKDPDLVPPQPRIGPTGEILPGVVPGFPGVPGAPLIREARGEARIVIGEAEGKGEREKKEPEPPAKPEPPKPPESR